MCFYNILILFRFSISYINITSRFTGFGIHYEANRFGLWENGRNTDKSLLASFLACEERWALYELGSSLLFCGWGRVPLPPAWLKRKPRDTCALHKDSFYEYVLLSFPRGSNSSVCNSFFKFSLVWFFFFLSLNVFFPQRFTEEKFLTFSFKLSGLFPVWNWKLQGNLCLQKSLQFGKLDDIFLQTPFLCLFHLW